MMLRARWSILIHLFCASHSTADAGLDFFEAKIRPVLVEHCYSCHSSAAKKTKGGLSLDTRDGLRAGGDTGPAVVPGKPAESLMLKAVKHGDEPKMPPKGKLPETVIADLEKWVNQGAVDPRVSAVAVKPPTPEQGRDWWSFKPIARPSLPAGDAQQPIDRFLLAKLHEAGLKYNPLADRRTLVRRVYLDVLGLPPTPEQVNEFLNDQSASAYEKLVDRLLANPHYGERWARHWLDVARFGESSGYEHDNDRPHAYQYRDFVIAALNADVPFDKFARWQIAGDELAPENPLALKATGFLAAGLMNGQVTEREAVKERYESFDDWVGTTGTAFLGLTIGCARCHDHKFDPIPTKDYYRLAATFTATVRANLNVPREPQADRLANVARQRRIEESRSARAQHEDSISRQVEAWKALHPKPPTAPWLVVRGTEVNVGDTKQSRGGNVLAHQADDSYLFTRLNGDVGTITVEVQTTLENISFVRFDALTDELLPNYGPGLGNSGEFRINSFTLTAAPLDGNSEPKNIKLSLAESSNGEKTGGASWHVDTQHAGRDQWASFQLAEPVGFPGGTKLTFKLNCPGDSPAARQTIGRFRLSITNGASPGDGPSLTHDEFIQGLRDLESGPCSPAVVKLYCLSDGEWLRLDAAVRAAEHAPRPASDVTFGVTEGVPPYRMMVQGPDLYEQSHILKRGDPDRPEAVASPGFLQVLTRAEETQWNQSPPKGSRASFRRANLANWLTDVDKGAGSLAARVIVNRLWQHHFGRGIVATPSDFGAQGDRPTHPELLDWLASELIARKWSLKSMHKLILMSQAYQQTGGRNPAAEKTDPDNKLLWRFAPRRLEAEAIRDSMLAVSGKLDPTLFGPGTLDESSLRRSIYFTVKRSKLIPALVQFDWPEALTGIGRRTSTAVPPQALWAMNNPQVRTFASAFAKSLEGLSPDDAVTAAYERALARPPSTGERATAVAFLKDGSLTDLAQTLFLLNEFVSLR